MLCSKIVSLAQALEAAGANIISNHFCWHEAPVQAAIEKTLKAVAQAGKCPGILALNAEDEARYAAWGARYFANVSTALILKAFREAAGG